VCACVTSSLLSSPHSQQHCLLLFELSRHETFRYALRTLASASASASASVFTSTLSLASFCFVCSLLFVYLFVLLHFFCGALLLALLCIISSFAFCTFIWPNSSFSFTPSPLLAHSAKNIFSPRTLIVLLLFFYSTRLVCGEKWCMGEWEREYVCLLTFILYIVYALFFIAASICVHFAVVVLVDVAVTVAVVRVLAVYFDFFISLTLLHLLFPFSTFYTRLSLCHKWRLIYQFAFAQRIHYLPVPFAFVFLLCSSVHAVFSIDFNRLFICYHSIVQWDVRQGHGSQIKQSYKKR